MEKKSLYRFVMLVVGLLAACVILLSQSYYKEEEQSRVKQEQSDTKKEAQTVVSAPSDLLPSGSVQVVENTPFQFSDRSTSQPVKNFFKEIRSVFSSFFKTLFRTIISPNAP